jgi:hypothetical protein
MSLSFSLRGFRATTTLALTAALAISPAAADAAAKKPVKKAATVKKEANGKKPAAGKVQAIGKRQSTTTPATPATDSGLGKRMGLGPTTQLAAMSTALKASPSYWTGLTTGCKVITPMLANQPGQIMAGNFRDSGGNCYVWLNLNQSSALTGSEICKTTLHEMGHLNGLQHSTNPLDVMYSPFQIDPIPAVCAA